MTYVRPFQRNKYAVGAACSRPFTASQTRGGCAAAPTHDFVWQALDTYFFESALDRSKDFSLCPIEERLNFTTDQITLDTPLGGFAL